MKPEGAYARSINRVADKHWPIGGLHTLGARLEMSAQDRRALHAGCPIKAVRRRYGHSDVKPIQNISDVMDILEKRNFHYKTITYIHFHIPRTRVWSFDGWLVAVEPVCLGATGTAVHFDTGRIHHEIGDSLFSQPACSQKPSRPASFVDRCVGAEIATRPSRSRRQ